MNMKKIILSVLLALSFSAYSSPKNVVLGEFEIGATTKDQAVQILENRNCSFSDYDDLLKVDNGCYNLPNVQYVTIKFNANTKTLSAVCIGYQKSMGGTEFKTYLSTIKKKYGKPSKLQTPFVGNRYALWKGKTVVVEIDEPHMSFDATVTYLERSLYDSIIKSKKAKENKNSQDLNELL